MSWFRSVVLRLYGFLFAARVERRIDDEFRFHLEMRTRENLAAGMSPEQAAADASRRFGNRTYLAELSRDIRGGGILDLLSQDLRYAFRILLRHPMFTSVAVVTLALGIAANVAIFSVVHAVLLGPLPYDNPDRLIVLWSNLQNMGASRAPASGPQLREIRERSQLFEDVAAIWAANGTLTGEAEPEQVKVGYVTSNIFSVLGAGSRLGRSFVPEEEGFGGRPAIILSHSIWARRYGSDPEIVGRSVRFEGGTHTVVGVMPGDFQLLFSPDANVPPDIQVWVPFPYDLSASPADLYFLRVIGRMKAGVTLAQAQNEANGIAEQLRARYPDFQREDLRLDVVPLHGDAVRNARTTLLALMAGAGLVLLISCANVANLLLTRATVRRREIALRSALGGSQWRIIRQLLCEGLLLCLVSGAVGLVVGLWAIEPLLKLQSANLPQLGNVQLNIPIAVFVTAISFAAGLICGLAPALETRRLSLIESLKGAGQSGIAPASQRMRSAFIVVEVALGFVLIVCAGLMVRTLSRLGAVDPGFSPDHVLTFEINLSPSAYPTDDSRTNVIRLCEERLSSLPEVQSVGAISHLPFDDYPNWYSPYAPEGVTPAEKGGLLADHRAITPGYFRAVGGRLVAGRYFDAQDRATSKDVVIVDDVLAKSTWPGQNAIGKRLEVEHYNNGDFTPRSTEVVGVVEHIRSHNLTQTGRGQIYIPYAQSARPHLSYVVKSGGDPISLVGSIRNELRALDAELALSKVRPMTDYVNRARARTDFTALLSSLFALLALVLAVVGIYGVVSHSVSQRTHEIGIRMALGARSADILRLILGKGVGLVVAGIAIGACTAFAVTRFMSSLLFGVSATDTITFSAVTLLLLGVALAANYLPARRATRVDPLTALRAE